MSDTKHFEIPRTLVYKIIGGLLVIAIGLCLYIYQGDEQATKESLVVTRESLKTNQQAIQATLDVMFKNEKDIAVGKTRMDGHVVNITAHTN